ncbi:MAG: YbhB/YbcL family Raf kinase inhibitor-like protein [Betaproteobacteria bacterium]|nr:YbhB/YbcL family Raf kinase inhibitor-like protein [Betaproteobacteria bacterium]
MKLWSNSFKDGTPIPGEFALAVPATQGHVTFSSNRNPHLEWSDVPSGTKSLVLICHDPDVPSRGDDVNQEGRQVPADLPRVDFFHWLLVDLPADMSGIAPGAFSEGVTPQGKSGPETGMEARQGINDYTGWFAGDAAMTGNYFGYDGPCPPWNDMLPHRYIFTLYALDIARVPLDGAFTGVQLRTAITGHILAEAMLMGRYTLNPAVKL